MGRGGVAFLPFNSWSSASHRRHPASDVTFYLGVMSTYSSTSIASASCAPVVALADVPYVPFQWLIGVPRVPISAYGWRPPHHSSAASESHHSRDVSTRVWFDRCGLS